MPGELNIDEIEKTSEILGLPQAYIRKDFYLTKSIHALCQVNSDHFNLIFQGGTSLSKGYKIVKRLSEDSDFRIQIKESMMGVGKNIKRTRLRDFRHQLIGALNVNGIFVDEKHSDVFYEGKFMRIRGRFENDTELDYLKPYLSIEFFYGDVILSPETREITTLVKETLGHVCQHG